MKIQVIILAAGIGSRLKEITSKIPKCLTLVNQKTILEHQIEAYLHAGVSEENIYVVTGYKKELIELLLYKKFPKVQTVFNEYFLKTNNMFSLWLALQKIMQNRISTDFFLISNGDCIYDRNIIASVLCDDRGNLIACDTSAYQDESMKIVVNQNLVIDISKDISQRSSYASSIDLYKFDLSAIQKLISIIEGFIFANQNNLWTEVAIKKLLKLVPVFPYDISPRKWIEIDNIQDLITADCLFNTFELTSKKVCFCDIDGTLFLGESPIRDAIDFVQKNSDKIDFFFLTNNTSKIPSDYIEKFKKVGLDICEKQILTPLIPLIDYINKHKLKNPFLVCNTKVKDYIISKLNDPTLDDKSKYDGVVLTYDTELNYQKLCQASLILQNKNSYFLASHQDISCPTEEGFIPDAGSFISLFRAMGICKKIKTFGKPNKDILSKVVNLYDKQEMFFVGDRLYTDFKFAQKMGIDFVCVLSGETKRHELQFVQQSKNQLYILPKLSNKYLRI